VLLRVKPIWAFIADLSFAVTNVPATVKIRLIQNPLEPTQLEFPTWSMSLNDDGLGEADGGTCFAPFRIRA
jgi:hypothetical protein